MPINKLESLLLNESKRVEKSTTADDFTSVIQLVKTIDYQYFDLFGLENITASQKLAQYEYGWDTICFLLKTL